MAADHILHAHKFLIALNQKTSIPWPFVNIDQVTEMIGGGTPSRSESSYWNGTIPWLTPTSMSPPRTMLDQINADGLERITEDGLRRSSTRVIPAGSVIYSTRATIGKVGINSVPLCTNQGFTSFIPDTNRINARFLGWLLLWITPQIESLCGSTTFKEVSKTSLRQIEIPLPPLPEQHRIVEILDQADTLRQKRSQAVALSQRILPALFHEMFGSERFPVMSLDDVSDGKNGVKCGPFGTQLSKSEFLESGVPLWGIKHVNKGFSFPTVEFISEEKADELSAYLLLPGDIVMTRKGTIGNAHIYPSDFVAGMMHSDLLRIRVDQSVVTPEFLYAQLVFNNDVVSQICADSTGAIMPGINVGKLKLTQLKIPPLKLQKIFTDRMKVVTGVTPQQATTTTTLETLFQTLLHRAFDGSLTAKWREARAKEVLQEMENKAR